MISKVDHFYIQPSHEELGLYTRRPDYPRISDSRQSMSPLWRLLFNVLRQLLRRHAQQTTKDRYHG